MMSLDSQRTSALGPLLIVQSWEAATDFETLTRETIAGPEHSLRVPIHTSLRAVVEPTAAAMGNIGAMHRALEELREFDDGETYMDIRLRSVGSCGDRNGDFTLDLNFTVLSMGPSQRRLLTRSPPNAPNCRSTTIPVPLPEPRQRARRIIL